jgi:tetratricopeptide (TPR) repeat protein
MKKIKISAVFSTAFLLLLFSVPLFPQVEEAEAVLEKCQESVIALTLLDENKEEINICTGFVVGDGIVATAYHLISRAADVEGLSFKGKKIKFEGVLAVDKNFDVALLKIKGKSIPLTLGDSDELIPGKSIFAIGCNDASELRIDDGTIKNILKLTESQWVSDTTLVSSETFCGGPVCDENGVVFGMLNFFDDRTRILMPINAIKSMSQTGTPAPFSGGSEEDYFETFEGVNLLGRGFFALEDFSKAERYLNKVVSFKPDELEVYNLLASIFTYQRNYSAAVSTYKKIIELNPNSDAAHYGLGEVHLKMMNWKEAIPALEKAFELNADNKEAILLTGNAYNELRDFVKAAEWYEKYIGMNPEDPTEAYSQLGQAYFEAGNFEKAAPAFKEALKANNQDINLNYKLAQAYHKSGQYELAEKLYSFLAELSPEDVRIYYNTIVMMYDEAKIPEKAVEAARKLVDIEPDNSEALYNLGYMLIKQKKFADSVDVFNRTIELNPGMEYAYHQLGYSHTQLKQWAKSVEVYQKLADVMPDNADAWMGIGQGYMQQKKWDPAVEPLKKVIDLKPDNAYAYYNLAICYLNLNDNFSAREIHGKLKTIDPSLASKLAGYLR